MKKVISASFTGFFCASEMTPDTVRMSEAAKESAGSMTGTTAIPKKTISSRRANSIATPIIQ
jgi:hypothetical protein